MFREIMGLLMVLIIMKIALPHEIGDLATDILLKVLTLIRDALNNGIAPL